MLSASLIRLEALDTAPDCLPHQVRAIGLEWEPLRLKALDTAPDAADGALLYRFWTSDRTVFATDCD
jgi:hypothetical protein